MYNEKRRHKRYQKELVVVLKYDLLDHFVKAISDNVSLGGMCIHLEHDSNIQIGKVLSLQFEVEGYSEVVELKSLVKWMSKPQEDGKIQVGVEFTQIDNPEMSSLKKKLKDLLESVQ